MRNETEVREMLERIIHKYVQMEKQKRDYGTGIEFSQAEIHTIAFIGENPGARQEDLRNSKGVTKGAASQMVTKLEGKGLVERRASQTSNAEVALYLTEEGRKAFEGHQKYHSQMAQGFYRIFQELPEQEYEVFVRILKACDDCLCQL